MAKAGELPPNLEYPVVDDGWGAVRGLHPLEHEQWTRGLRHPAVSETVRLEPDLRWAVEFASDGDILALDKLRRTRSGALVKVAADLEPERAVWTARADVSQQKLAARSHGLLIMHLTNSVGRPDKEFEQDVHGFQLVGRLPPAGYAFQPTKAKARCGDVMKWLKNLQVLREVGLRLKERLSRQMRCDHYLTIRERALFLDGCCGSFQVYCGGGPTERCIIYTHMRVPDEIWSSLLDKNDDQSGFQEALAVFLFIGIFESVIMRSSLLGLVDSGGVRSSMLKGSCKAPEINTLIGRFWLDWQIAARPGIWRG